MDNEWAGFFFGFHLSFSFSKKVFLNNFKIWGGPNGLKGREIKIQGGQ